MADINHAGLQEIVHGSVAYTISSAYGAEAGEPLRVLLSNLRLLLKELDIDNFKGTLVVFKSLITPMELLPRANGRIINQIKDFSATKAGPVVVEVIGDGRFCVWQMAVNPNVLSGEGLVYRFEDGLEGFYTKQDFKPVAKLGPAFRSIFAVPTYSDLTVALERYHAEYVKDSYCTIFRTAWWDDNRLFFRQRPEHIMRDSLRQYLSTVLDAEVLPEISIDGVQPIDIRVYWADGNSIALIEIKWLGKSVYADGKFATPYAEGRARDGLNQLIGYLEDHKPAARTKVTFGYLVVFDGRRRHLTEGLKEITKEDGLHYEHLDIDYPAEQLARADVKTPMRFFAHPKIK